MSELMDQRIKQLWYCLPADTMKEIVARLNKRMSSRLSLQLGHVLLRHLRDHSVEYGWIVPIAKRGRAEHHRYVRVSVSADGKMMFDHDDARDKLEGGLHGTVLYTQHLNQHQTASLLAAVANTRSSKYREFIEGLAEDCEALGKKAARVAKIIELGRDAA